MSVKKDVTVQLFDKILQWQQSGLTQKAYCERESIAYHVFHYYYKRFREKENIGSTKFIQLQITHAQSAPAELVLADARRLLLHQGVSADFLKALIS